jgi:DNA-binding beta-propeller fold protein YncE
MPGGQQRLLLVLLILAVLASFGGLNPTPVSGTPTGQSSTPDQPRTSPREYALDMLPGMAVADPHNVYAAAGAGMLSPVVRQDRPLVYLPHTNSGDVWVIDPATFTVIARYPAGQQPQHVVPSYDMRTLYATDSRSNHLLAFDPRTGLPIRQIPVIDPYNMYFTPDGKYAISVAEARRELVWYDPHSWIQRDVTPTPACAGINHADFSADGRAVVFSCEFGGAVAVVDVAAHQLLRIIPMPARHSHMGPQDVKLAPDGSAYYVADCDAGGLWVLDGAATTVRRFIPTGRCAHGLYLSRDAKRLFVSNRGEGSISVLDVRTAAPITKWHIPGGGSPDMGNVTADGTQLWLSGRYDNVVYVLSTVDGALIRKIPVGSGPHGLLIWPQPGRYSLGHTGITR